MHGFGFKYNRYCLFQEPDILNYYNLHKEEYPLKEIYNRFLEIIKNTFKNSDLSSHFVPLMHHSRLAGLMHIPEIKQGLQYFISNAPENMIHSVHYPFNPAHRLVGDRFKSDFIKYLPYYEKWGIHSIVVHPSKGSYNTIAEIAEVFNDEKLLKRFAETKMIMAIENMNSKKDFFGDLNHLEEMRLAIIDQLKAKGYGTLSNQIAFCFDTGHYLKYLMQIHDHIPSNELVLEPLKEIAPFIKVFHISTNTAQNDDHVFIRRKFYPLPHNKQKKLKGIDEDQQLLIEHSQIVMDWMKLCYDHRHPEWDLEFLHEVNDFITPEALQRIGKWMIKEIMDKK